jgi:hypothetical protein
MTKHQYFVLETSLWNTDGYKPVAGSFPTRKAAQKVADERQQDSADAKQARKTIVLSKTAIRKQLGLTIDEIYESIRYQAQFS